MINARFTWTNGQENPTMCRLDRFLVSNCWEDHFPQFIQVSLLKVALDHWPIILNTSTCNYIPSLFRYENMWITHPSFKEKIENDRSVMCLGRKGFVL